MLRLNINGVDHSVDVEPEMPLLWVIREQIGLTGTKFGCGIAQCGACTVHVNGEPVRSCSLPVSNAVNKKITTIEGLTSDSSHPIQLKSDVNYNSRFFCYVEVNKKINPTVRTAFFMADQEHEQMPDSSYLSMCIEGYEQNGVSTRQIQEALDRMVMHDEIDYMGFRGV